MKNNSNKPSLSLYLKKYKMVIFLYLFIYFMANICTVLYSIFMAHAIEMITLSNYSGAIRRFLYIILLVIIERLGWYTSGLIYNKYSIRIMADINYDLTRQLFKLDSKTYTDHNTGTFVQRIVSDPSKAINTLTRIVDMLTDSISALIMLIYISTLNAWISLGLVVIILIALCIEFIRTKKFRKNTKIVNKKNDEIYSLSTEIVRSEKDVKSLGLEEKLSEMCKTNYMAYQNANYKLMVTNRNLFTIRNIFIQVSSLLLLILGITLMEKSLMVLSTFMIIYSNNQSLYRVVWGVGDIANSVVELKVCIERMFGLFDNDEFVVEDFGDKEVPKVTGNIEFKNVSFSYLEYEKPKHDKNKKEQNKEKKLISKKTVFDDLSFKIKNNTTVAFVGKSGSGKSTILNLMSKMYKTDKGEILLDGININDFDKQSLRNNISLVNQFPYIFDMTIKENLLLAKGNATDEEIIEAIDRASLKEFVMELPKGIDTKVGESGIKLSGGQKQRLAIARALLRNSSIIIFDESTSSLDNFAQNDIKTSIDNLKGKSTIIIVAHRLSTIRDADTIFFLDNGVIVDSGTFEELFNRNDKFKTMFLAENL